MGEDRVKTPQPDTREPQGSELPPRRSGFPDPPRLDSAGGAGGGRKPAGTPSPSREGPGNRGGAPAGRRQGLRLWTAKRGVEWGRATPLAPTPLIPPDSGKSGRPGVSQG